jgi:hypothetical protein
LRTALGIPAAGGEVSGAPFEREQRTLPQDRRLDGDSAHRTGERLTVQVDRNGPEDAIGAPVRLTATAHADGVRASLPPTRRGPPSGAVPGC